MTTFTTEDRQYVQMYEQIQYLQLQIHELNKKVEFWKMVAENLETQINQLVRSK